MISRTLAATGAALTASAGLAQEPSSMPLDQLPGVGASLAAVLVLIALMAWIVRRFPLGGLTRSKGPLKIVGNLALGPKERLILVETEECRLLLGVSCAGIVTLHCSGRSADEEMPPTPRSLDVPELLQVGRR